MDAGAACGRTEGGVGSSALFRRVERGGQATGRGQRRIPARAARRNNILDSFCSIPIIFQIVISRKNINRGIPLVLFNF